MRRAILSIVVILSAALSCLAESAATNAAPGEKLCRQHLKIANRKSGGPAAVH